ncbi:MAG: ribose 5-phosphate isomerase B [Calditrichaeota bacterium]|nr:MAG: ribose 5-phosphate isomerase B [Calditrichota bacterium]
MKVGIGSDHAGFVMKEAIIKFLEEKKIEFIDYGTFKEESVNYPDYALKVSKAVTDGDVDYGILICGTGIGMSITANKVKGIRAALCHNEETARMSRLHNNANVLCLGGRVLEESLALKMVELWLNTSFEGGRHENRIKLISTLTGL